MALIGYRMNASGEKGREFSMNLKRKVKIGGIADNDYQYQEYRKKYL